MEKNYLVDINFDLIRKSSKPEVFTMAHSLYGPILVILRLYSEEKRKVEIHEKFLHDRGFTDQNRLVRDQVTDRTGHGLKKNAHFFHNL